MAATIDISCPKCRHTSKGPADLKGKKIRCKSCEHVFVVGAEAPKETPRKAATPAAKPTPSSAAKPPDDFVEKTPYIMVEENLAARCPHCALALDPPDARICINCGYDMRDRSRAATKLTVANTGGDYLKWHLPTIAAIFGILTMIAVNVVCILNMNDWLEGAFFSSVLKPDCFTLWIIILSAGCIWIMGRFAFRRLVWHFAPPEQEKKKKKEEDL
jgi:hypothetical protein